MTTLSRNPIPLACGKNAELAADRRHLTAAQAGMLAGKAGACRVVPFHFSPSYLGREDKLRREVEAAWRG